MAKKPTNGRRSLRQRARDRIENMEERIGDAVERIEEAFDREPEEATEETLIAEAGLTADVPESETAEEPADASAEPEEHEEQSAPGEPDVPDVSAPPKSVGGLPEGSKDASAKVPEHNASALGPEASEAAAVEREARAVEEAAKRLQGG